MERSGLWKAAVVLFVFCAATGIASSAQTLTTLVSFDYAQGAYPFASLVQGADGNFYGTTEGGGSTDCVTDGCGTLFKITTAGALTSLYSFCTPLPCYTGYQPYAALIQANDGNFYGTASEGGDHGRGSIFKMTPAGVVTELHGFNGSDGDYPYAALVQASDGNFYGTTGGYLTYGSVFKMTPDGVVTALYLFQGQPDGGDPYAPLVEGADGNFYGTTYYGGANDEGTVFKITPTGTLTTLYSFSGPDGSSPDGALLLAADGNFYGTTRAGGANSSGTVFKITAGGTLTTLYSFGAEGRVPVGALVQASDGSFYGTTYEGGTGGVGTIFKLTPDGTLTTLHNFRSDGADGAYPAAGLVIGGDGNFYGTTAGGGANAPDGTVFQLSVAALVSTTTALTSAPNPSNVGQSVTMTATVTAHDGSNPTGTVTFTSNGASIGSAALSGGVAVLNYSGLPAGTDNLVATYQGSATLAGSTSNTVMQVVNGVSSTTTVTSTPNPSTFGQSVTITATVGPAGPPTPTGTVSFTLYGGAIAGCTDVPLMADQALCMTASLPTGTDLIAATYSGDSNYSGSSGMLTQIVNPVPSPVQFVAVTPCRVVDTRNPDGDFGGPAIPGHSSRDFPLSRNDNPCGIPTTAVAYSLNVTVVPSGRLGYSDYLANRAKDSPRCP